MLPNNEITKDVLQEYCDQIIAQLEKAVQAAVLNKHFKSDSPRGMQKAIQAANQTKNCYFQTISDLYFPNAAPIIYTEVFNSAISKPSGTTYCSSSDGDSHLSAKGSSLAFCF